MQRVGWGKEEGDRGGGLSRGVEEGGVEMEDAQWGTIVTIGEILMLTFG